MTSLFMNKYDDLPPGLQDLAQRLDRREGEGRRDGDASTNGPRPQVSMRNLTALIAVGGMLFAAGENWHRIDALTDTVQVQKDQNEKDHERFANKEAVDEHYNALKQEIQDLRDYLMRQPPAGRR